MAVPELAASPKEANGLIMSSWKCSLLCFCVCVLLIMVPCGRGANLQVDVAESKNMSCALMMTWKT